MKRMNYLLSVCLMVCLAVATNASAQNESYKDLMVRMIKAGVTSNTASAENMKPAFIQMATEAVGKKHSEMNEAQKGALATELVERYMQKQVFEDMAVAIMPYFEKNVSLENMKAYVEVAENERFQDVNKRMTAISETAAMELMPGFMAMAEGKTPETIAAAECSDSYKKLFKNYYEKSGCDIIIDQLTTSISALMQQTEGAAIFENMMNYMKSNFEAIMLNGCIKGGITEDDLKYLVGISEMPAYSGAMAAVQEMLGDIMGFDMKLMGGFSTWLEEAIERERQEKQQRWQAIADGLNQMTNTLIQTTEKMQQINEQRNNTSTLQSAGYSSSSNNKSYSSTSTSTTNHSSTSRCKECHDSKRCKHCNGGYTKYTGNQSLNGFVGAPVCGFCYGTGICQKCATNKASSSMLCGKCKGNRYCMTCNGTGKVNYGKEKCPICKGEKVCQTCKGSGKR